MVLCVHMLMTYTLVSCSYSGPEGGYPMHHAARRGCDQTLNLLFQNGGEGVIRPHGSYASSGPSSFPPWMCLRESGRPRAVSFAGFMCFLMMSSNFAVTWKPLLEPKTSWIGWTEMLARWLGDLDVRVTYLAWCRN